MAPTQGGCVGDTSVGGGPVRYERQRPSAQTGNRAEEDLLFTPMSRSRTGRAVLRSSEQSWAGPGATGVRSPAASLAFPL